MLPFGLICSYGICSAACEAAVLNPLLCIRAQANVLAPNKHSAAAEAMWRGHLLDSETYIGGKVEALESGIFRSDLPTRFKLQPAAYQVRSCAGDILSQPGVDPPCFVHRRHCGRHHTSLHGSGLRRMPS